MSEIKRYDCEGSGFCSHISSRDLDAEAIRAAIVLFQHEVCGVGPHYGNLEMMKHIAYFEELLRVAG